MAALLEESKIQKQLVDVERENLRVDKEVRDAEWARLEEEKEKLTREKEAEKRKKEESKRRAERERKKRGREENERKWAREREEKKRKEREEKEREEKKKEEKEKEEKKRKESEEEGKVVKEAKGEKRKSAASFGWDAGNGSSDSDDEDITFHFEGRTLPPEMFDIALGARRHQDTAENMNLFVAHMMTARKHHSKLRRKGELPVSHLIYSLKRNSLALRSKFTWLHFSSDRVTID